MLMEGGVAAGLEQRTAAAAAATVVAEYTHTYHTPLLQVACRTPLPTSAIGFSDAYSGDGASGVGAGTRH